MRLNVSYMQLLCVCLFAYPCTCAPAAGCHDDICTLTCCGHIRMSMQEANRQTNTHTYPCRYVDMFQLCVNFHS